MENRSITYTRTCEVSEIMSIAGYRQFGFRLLDCVRDATTWDERQDHPWFRDLYLKLADRADPHVYINQRESILKSLELKKEYKIYIKKQN